MIIVFLNKITNPISKKAAHRKFKILHLAKWYPYAADPHFGIFVQEQIKQLKGETLAVALFVHGETKLKQAYKLEESDVNGFYEYRAFYSKKEGGFFNRLISLINYYRTLHRAVKSIVVKHGEFDLLHVHILLRMGIYAWWLNKRSQIPYMITEHWSVYLKSRSHLLGKFKKKWMRKVINNASAVTAVSETLKMGMVDTLAVSHAQIDVVPNFVDLRNFIPKPKNEAKDIFSFLHISEFNDDVKNVSGIIHTVDCLLKKGYQFEMTIVGYGADEDKIIQLVHDLDLKGTVHLTGRQKLSDLPRYYQNADCFILFSHFETFAIVLLEAAASGLPIISTNVGIASMLINEHSGILLEQPREELLISAMAEIMTNADHYKAADSKLLAPFSADSFRAQMINLYNAILKERKE